MGPTRNVPSQWLNVNQSKCGFVPTYLAFISPDDFCTKARTFHSRGSVCVIMATNMRSIVAKGESQADEIEKALLVVTKKANTEEPGTKTVCDLATLRYLYYSKWKNSPPIGFSTNTYPSTACRVI